MSATLHTNDCVRQRAKFGARSSAGDVCSCDGDLLPEIVRRAMTDTVVNTGQLTIMEKRVLDKYVKQGYLSKGVGGPFPKEKTVWAVPGYDFDGHRQAHVDHMIRLSELDREAAEQRTSNQHHECKGGE